MKVRIGVPVACFCALSLAICAEPSVRAQAPGRCGLNRRGSRPRIRPMI